ncbi:MAG: hypothetical protein LRZ85_00355 [Alphaproteobacteria bacterium]|nr:hypothetical protein [Alphaproteobacteria bacterium]
MRFVFSRLALSLTLAALLPILLWNVPSVAQVLRTVKIELTGEAQSVDIGSEIYITRDDSRALNYSTVLTRHLNNQRGVRQGGSVIDLGTDGAPSWLVFSVENRTDQENWILDFGSPAMAAML